MIPVAIKKLHMSAIMPVYATAHSSCADVSACIPFSNDNPLGSMSIEPGETKLVPTGLAVRPDDGFGVKLHPRSGLALKHGITLANCTGVIDNDYPGELGVLLRNEGSDTFVVDHGMRIAQMEVHAVLQAGFHEVDELPAVAAVEGAAVRTSGFGSTGTQALAADHEQGQDPAWEIKTEGGMAVAVSTAADRSKDIGQAFAMFGELMLECSIESATGVTHFASEEVGNALRMLGENIKNGHAVVVTHDMEMAHQVARQAIESLQKV